MEIINLYDCDHVLCDDVKGIIARLVMELYQEDHKAKMKESFMIIEGTGISSIDLKYHVFTPPGSLRAFTYFPWLKKGCMFCLTCGEYIVITSNDHPLRIICWCKEF